jgi:hypothetical protein
MALEGITEVDAVVARLKALATRAGAEVQRNEGQTTNLIANNGNI